MCSDVYLSLSGKKIKSTTIKAWLCLTCLMEKSKAEVTITLVSQQILELSNALARPVSNNYTCCGFNCLSLLMFFRVPSHAATSPSKSTGLQLAK